MAATTFNPSDKSAGITLSGGNLTAANSTGTDQAVRATDFKKTGKYFFEVTTTTIANADDGVGIGNDSAILTSVGLTPSNAAILFRSGSIWVNNVNTLGGFGTLPNGQLVGIAVDLDNERIWFRFGAAGNWNNSATADPASNVGGRDISGFATTGVTKIMPLVCMKSNTDSFTANFGGSAFTGAAPSGFTSGWPVNANTKRTTCSPLVG